MITIVLTYGVMFILSLVIFLSTSLKTYYIDKLSKIKDYSKVVLFAILWPIFLPILIFGFASWRK